MSSIITWGELEAQELAFKCSTYATNYCNDQLHFVFKYGIIIGFVLGIVTMILGKVIYGRLSRDKS